MIRIGRCQPPAAAPLSVKDIFYGLIGLCRGGSELERFENELNSFYRMKYSFLVSSGKTALTTILQALKEISPGRDEVLIPAFTCYSVPSAIIRAGLKIRLCDLAPGTFDFDYEQLSNIISTNKERLLCVLPVHLFGFPADLKRIREIIADDSVFIVEDAAQAMGGEFGRNKLGTIGDVGFFSLGRGKALSTVEGGVILTKRDDIASHLEKTVNTISCYGISDLLALLLYALALLVLSRPSMFWLPKAFPFLRLGETIYDPDFAMRKMSSFQAGLARGWEKKLDRFRKLRTDNAKDLMNRLKAINIKPGWADLCDLTGVLRFPLKIESAEIRELILFKSEQMGLGIASSYPDSIDGIEQLRLEISDQVFPKAKEHAQKMITLPVHPYLSRKDKENIALLLECAK